MTPSSAPSGDTLVEAILDFLTGHDVPVLQGIRGALEAEIEAAGPDALRALKAHLVADNGWTYYPPDPLARAIHHVWLDRLQRESATTGVEHLRGLPDGPLVLCGNHLSYSDANL